ncbi:MAG: restriction endonuclease subunit R [Bacteroidetes bacterium]|nr:MAG: restriction endonuclease subunit R [Bacteroidota bacterium]
MQLNFDNFNFQVKTENNRNIIFDIVRKKYVELTPEEWVRQHCLHQLIKNGFPPGRISVERNLPNSKKRYDVAYLNAEGKPSLLVECKAPKVVISQKTLNQVAGYISLWDVPNILLTNGLHHYFFSRINNKLEIVQEFPAISRISD